MVLIQKQLDDRVRYLKVIEVLAYQRRVTTLLPREQTSLIRFLPLFLKYQSGVRIKSAALPRIYFILLPRSYSKVNAERYSMKRRAVLSGSSVSEDNFLRIAPGV